MKKLIIVLSLLSLSGIYTLSHAESSAPWYTGPLLAPAGKTIPQGHANFEPYAFYTTYPEGFRNFEALPVLTVGLTSFLDLQTSFPYDVSWDQHHQGNNIGDFSLGFGFQIFRQNDDSLLPDFRLVFQEIFPTGKFDHLNPNQLLTDQTGNGAYVTSLGFNFQRLTLLPNNHHLRTRFIFVAATASDVHVEGFNVFGGSANTKGEVHPGNSFSTDLAFEYSIDHHWVPVFEALYAHSDRTGFIGNSGFTPAGLVASVGGSGGDQAFLAPALEYNFTSNVGLIGGIWFSVTGPHAAKFVATTVALNYYI